MSEDFIIKSSLKDNYSVMPNDLINNDRLDADSLAVLVYLLSKPSNWIVKPTNIQNRFKYGKEKTYKIIKVLIDERYIYRQVHRVENKYDGYTYYVYDSPFPDFQETEKQYTEKQETENQYITKEREVLNKEKIQSHEQKTASDLQWDYFKRWLGEYVSIKKVGEIVGLLKSKAFHAGYTNREDKDKLLLPILQSAFENKPEGDVTAYLLKIFDNKMDSLSALNIDREQTKWETYAEMWGRGRWSVNDCPRPDDPHFKAYCPAKYQPLFEVKHE